MALFGEFAQHGAGRLRAAGVEVDEHIVEDHRQVDAAAGVRRHERQPQADEQLLARAAAEHLHRKRLALGRIDEQDSWASGVQIQKSAAPARSSADAMSEALHSFGELLAAALGGAVTGHDVAYGELTVTAKASEIVNVIRYLRDEQRFVSFIDVTAVDWPGRERRFDVVYHLLSPYKNRRVRVKIEVGEDDTVASIIGIFPGADWFERETYDLYGIPFVGHPDMRRILTDYGFEGHPLRKDFPLTGFVEVRYDDQQKRVVYDKVRLAQEFRNFDFLSPWEGPDYKLPGDEKAEQKP